MKQKSNSQFWVQILCWVLIAMMILGGATYLIYALLGLM